MNWLILRIIDTTNQILDRFQSVRSRTELITSPLEVEDYVVQPVVDVSPPKWHLAHTSWFFETFLLKRKSHYRVFDDEFNFLFNSYYESIGERTIRTDRGNITRPTVKKILEYRKYINDHMVNFIMNGLTEEESNIVELGLQHEEQHQELLVTDIKYILGHNPTFPIYSNNPLIQSENENEGHRKTLTFNEGIYEIGFKGDGFCFDNELSRHKVFLHEFSVDSSLVTNAEYLQFIEDKGYFNSLLWHAEGWDWVNTNKISCPMYWHYIEGKWHQFTLKGLQKLDLNAPLAHISYYEANAFAEWRNKRLPTEFEREIASTKLKSGIRWEWTNSAYLPYPDYKKPEGAIGEYNGKFMVNQMVLKGGSCATAPGHTRSSYRNFFHPHLQWQFSGIRLAEKHNL